MAESTIVHLPCELTKEYFETVFYIILPFTALYLHIVPEISRRLFPTLKVQIPDRQNSFVSDCVSTIPSTLTGIITLHSFYYYVPNYDPERMFYGFRWCSILMTAYLVVDTIYRIFYIRANVRLMVVHHLIGLVITQLAMHDRGWLFQKLVFCLMEIANPFINLRLMMLGIGFSKKSYRFIAVSMAMFVVFGLTRIVPIPYMVITGSRLLINSPQEGTWVHINMFVLYVSLSFFNLYWFYRMLRGLAKIIQGLEQPEY